MVGNVMLIENPPEKPTTPDYYLDAWVNIYVFTQGGNGKGGGKGTTRGLVTKGCDNRGSKMNKGRLINRWSLTPIEAFREVLGSGN